MSEIQNEFELYHHGIRGQKWGVRRYQNADGSLTKAGKLKYGTKTNFEKVQAAKKAATEGKKAKDLRDKQNATTEAEIAKYKNKGKTKKELLAEKETKNAEKKASKEKSRTKSLSEMSNEEIQAKIDRIRLENTLKSLTPTQVSKGEAFVNYAKDLALSTAKDVTTNVVKKYAEKKVKELLGVKDTLSSDDLKRLASDYENRQKIDKGQRYFGEGKYRRSNGDNDQNNSGNNNQNNNGNNNRNNRNNRNNDGNNGNTQNTNPNNNPNNDSTNSPSRSASITSLIERASRAASSSPTVNSYSFGGNSNNQNESGSNSRSASITSLIERASRAASSSPTANSYSFGRRNTQTSQNNDSDTSTTSGRNPFTTSTYNTEGMRSASSSPTTSRSIFNTRTTRNSSNGYDRSDSNSYNNWLNSNEEAYLNSLSRESTSSGSNYVNRQLMNELRRRRSR